MSLSREIAGMIDHAILHPTATDKDLQEQCALAAKYHTASVCVKPYHIAKAVRLLADSDVLVCAVVGFPHGNSTTNNKVAETISAIEDGALEVDMVINVGKALQGDWAYVKKEITAINQACLDRDVILKVIFEIDYIENDTDIIRLCEICTEVGVAYVKTSTGFGFVKGKDGKYSYQGATIPRLTLMKEHIGPQVAMKASGGIGTLDQALVVRKLGVKRIGASATESIIKEAIERFG